MPNSHATSANKYANNVEAVFVKGAPVTSDPHSRRTTQLPLLPPIHRFHRVAEFISLSRFDFDEHDGSSLLDNEIDVAVTAPETALENAPTPSPQPSLRYSLSQFPQHLPGR